MPSVVIPPWLEAPDTAGEFLKGASIGASIGEAKARLQAEEQHASMEGQLRQQQIARETTLQQQQLATQQAYHQAQIGLRNQALDQAAQVNQFKMQNAARSMAANRQFETDVQSGMTIEAALLKNPGANPSTVIAAHKADEDTSAASLALRQQEFAERQAKDARTRGITKTVSNNPATGITTRFSGPADAFPKGDSLDAFFDQVHDARAAKAAQPAAPAETSPVADYGSKDDVVSAFKAGKLSRADAKKLLTERFGVKE